MFGVIFMSPTAGLVYYVTTQPWSGGFTWLAFAIAAVLIIFTVLSYQIMVQKFPQTGSAYTYASKGINGKAGFMTGWILLIDYALTPLFALSLSSIYLNSVFPAVPINVFIVCLGILVTICTCLGVKVSVMAQILIGSYLILLILFFDSHALIQIFSTGKPLFNPDTIYDPDKIIWPGVFQAVGLALLAHVGFDGITTLAEESKVSPKKISDSLMVSVIIIATLFISSTYLANTAMEWTTIPENDFPTAYRYMLSVWINPALAGTLVVLQKIGSVTLMIAAITATSRILYGMGRDRVINNRFFGHLSPRFNTPTRSTILIGIITIVGALTIEWYVIAEIVSFGACIGFIAVNLSNISFFWVKAKDKSQRRVLRNLVFPLFAAGGILWVMFSLSRLCLIAGFSWTAVGLLYLLIKYKTSEDFRSAINRGIEGL